MTTPKVERPLLSPRRKDVLQLVADGFDQRAIARLLTIERSTVAEHLMRCRVALDAATTAGAVGTALRRGLIS